MVLPGAVALRSPRRCSLLPPCLRFSTIHRERLRELTSSIYNKDAEIARLRQELVEMKRGTLLLYFLRT